LVICKKIIQIKKISREEVVNTVYEIFTDSCLEANIMHYCLVRFMCRLDEKQEKGIFWRKQVINASEEERYFWTSDITDIINKEKPDVIKKYYDKLAKKREDQKKKKNRRI